MLVVAIFTASRGDLPVSFEFNTNLLVRRPGISTGVKPNQ
jgi:hypothetical protein